MYLKLNWEKSLSQFYHCSFTRTCGDGERGLKAAYLCSISFSEKIVFGTLLLFQNLDIWNAGSPSHLFCVLKSLYIFFFFSVCISLLFCWWFLSGEYGHHVLVEHISSPVPQLFYTVFSNFTFTPAIIRVLIVPEFCHQSMSSDTWIVSEICLRVCHHTLNIFK